MPKNLSAVFKFQGTIENMTFVDSKAYGQHVRAKKNSKTPFVMTEALAESRDRLQVCNGYLKSVYQVLKPEGDTFLWSRMQSVVFAALKAGGPLSLKPLHGLECNLKHPMTDVIAGGYDFSATVDQNELRIQALLHAHPKVDDNLPRVGYQVRFVVIARGVGDAPVFSEVVTGPLTKYGDELVEMDLRVVLPEVREASLVAMGLVPHLQGHDAMRVMSDSGVRILWVE